MFRLLRIEIRRLSGVGIPCTLEPHYNTHFGVHSDISVITEQPVTYDIWIWSLDSWYEVRSEYNMTSGIWRPGYGVLDMASWIYRPGYGILDMASWIWRPGYGVLDMASWIWRGNVWNTMCRNMTSRYEVWHPTQNPRCYIPTPYLDFISRRHIPSPYPFISDAISRRHTQTQTSYPGQ